MEGCPSGAPADAAGDAEDTAVTDAQHDSAEADAGEDRLDIAALLQYAAGWKQQLLEQTVADNNEASSFVCSL